MSANYPMLIALLLDKKLDNANALNWMQGELNGLNNTVAQATAKRDAAQTKYDALQAEQNMLTEEVERMQAEIRGPAPAYVVAEGMPEAEDSYQEEVVPRSRRKPKGLKDTPKITVADKHSLAEVTRARRAKKAKQRRDEDDDDDYDWSELEAEPMPEPRATDEPQETPFDDEDL